MAVAYVNGTGGSYLGAGATSRALPAFTVTGGNFLVAIIRGASVVNYVSSVTDTAGNTYARAGAGAQDPSGDRLEMWYAKNITGHASNVITFNFASSIASTSGCAAQYSGIDTTAPFDTSAVGLANASTVTSAAFTTTTANQMLVGGSHVAAIGRVWTPDTGYTGRISDTDTITFIQDKVAASIQTGVTTSATASGGGGLMSIQAATFKAAAGGTVTGVGASAGVGTATGVGAATPAATAASTGAGVATATGAATAAGVGNAAGTGVATGVGAFTAGTTVTGVGASAGTGTATATGAATAAGVATASGTGTALGVGAAIGIISAVGNAAGTSEALGYSPQLLGGGEAGRGAKGGKRRRKRIEWVPPDVDIETGERLPVPAEELPPPPRIQLNRVERKLAQLQARARSKDEAVAAAAQARLLALGNDPNSPLAILVAKKHAVEAMRAAELARRQAIAAEDDEAAVAFMQWLLFNP